LLKSQQNIRNTNIRNTNIRNITGFVVQSGVGARFLFLDKEQKRRAKNACVFNQLFGTVLGFLCFVSLFTNCDLASSTQFYAHSAQRARVGLNDQQQLPRARNSAIQRRNVGMTASFPTPVISRHRSGSNLTSDTCCQQRTLCWRHRKAPKAQAAESKTATAPVAFSCVSRSIGHVEFTWTPPKAK
jgi:hypothetical protein